MTKTSSHTKATNEILALRNELREVLESKQQMLEKFELVTTLLNQEEAAQSKQRRQRRAGLPVYESENVDVDSLNLSWQDMHQRLRVAETSISNLEKKITFLEGEASGLTKAAKAGASGRKNKYAAMKAIALEWYLLERHRFQNKDDAAIEITKAHAVEFSTARGWLKGV